MSQANLPAAPREDSNRDLAKMLYDFNKMATDITCWLEEWLKEIKLGLYKSVGSYKQLTVVSKQVDN